MKCFRRLLLTILMLPVWFGENSANAAEALDQQFDATGGGSSVAVTSVSSLAQTFRVGLEGMLSRVDLMLGRTEQATGDFTLMILPTTDQGEPDGSVDALFSRTYPVTFVSAIGLTYSAIVGGECYALATTGSVCPNVSRLGDCGRSPTPILQ